MTYQEVVKCREAHYAFIDMYEQCVQDVADAEYDHDKALAYAVANLRNGSTPVTLIPKIAQADDYAARKKKGLAVAKGTLKAAEMRVQASYKDWKDATDLMEREWRTAGRE